MDKLVHLYSVFVATVAPFMLVTAIPSLVVALTPYPKAKGFLRALSYVAQFLSFLTHRDSPGTLKLPFVPVFEDKEEPKYQLPPGSSARALLPLAFLAFASISGCATTKTLFADEASKCGAKAAAALGQTEGVLMAATDAASALANIGTIIGAAATDVSAVYCIVEVAVADLKAKRSNDGGAAPADTQMRALVAGVYAYPTDPIAHGIAVGQDILALKK